MSSTIFFFLFIPLLAFILLLVNLIFAPHNPYMEKNSAFECGYSSFLGQNRTQFSISFFIFALLFLLFDLEILLVYPYLVSAYTNGVYGLAIILMFLLALTLGFAFELGKKALYIDSRQMSKVAIKKSSKVSVLPFLSVLEEKYYLEHFFGSKESKWFSLFRRFYSTRRLPLGYMKPKYKNFKFKSVPYNSKLLILPAREGLKYQILKRRVKKALGPFVAKQIKVGISVGTLNITSLGRLKGLSWRESLAQISGFLYFIITFKVNPIYVSYSEQGIEFIYCFEAIKKLNLMIKYMVENKPKNYEGLYIVISYWPLENNLKEDPFLFKMKDPLKDW